MPVTNESCTRDFWNWTSAAIPGVETHYNSSNEILLLANLHGNALEYREIISHLKPMISSVLVFYMTQSASELEANYTRLQSKKFFGYLGEENIFNVLIDPSADCEMMSDDVLDTSKLLDHSMIEKLYQLIMGSYHSKVENSGETIQLPSVKLVPEIKTSKSSDLLTQITSCRRVRQTFKLQKLKTGEQEFNQCCQLWNDDPSLQTIISLFISILRMPIKDRRIGLYHFEKEIGIRSMEESQEPRQQYMALNSKRRELAMSLSAKSEQFRLVYEEEMAKLDEINQSVLGPQHFFRELGRIYRLAQSNWGVQNHSLDAIRSLPKYYAELMMDGFAIELLDGDESNINDLWFCAIAHSVCQIKKNLRVFVISILGLQSSGKSTLLNALFGCQFDVSVGRCTRGLFMRLLFLEDKLVKQFGFDAFLIIDTEGLGSPEQISDRLAEEKDRRLSTFAMSISNLTIINILGESSSEMTAILQIVIIAMARLSRANIATQVLRVQHVSEKEESKLSAAEGQFFDALKVAIDLAENKSTQTGTVSSFKLKNIKRSLGGNGLVKYFGHFKSGAAPNAPPSEQYQNDIVDLYQMILEAAKQSSEYVNFCEWHELAVSYWKALQNEDFAVRFKNIREMCDFLAQASKISNINDLTDSSFRHHRTKMEDEIRKRIETNQHFDSKYFLAVLEGELKKIPVMCTSGRDPGSKCDFCCSVDKAKCTLFGEMEEKPDLPKTQDSIKLYEDTVRQNTLKHLEQSIHATRVQKGCLKEVDEIITAEINKRLQMKRVFSAEERGVIANEIWKKLKDVVIQKRTIDPLEDRLNDQINSAYGNHLIINGFVNDTGPKMHETEAFDVTKWKFWKDKNIKKKHLSQLRAEINYIVKMIFNDLKTNNLENGMVKRLQLSVDRICDEWKMKMNAPFTVEFKNALHLGTLRAFLFEAKEREKNWKSENDPLTILYDNENTFRKTINVRLMYGFSSESEGTIIADRLCMAILMKAKSAGSRRWVEDVLGQDWIHNSRNVRLHYFKTLAEEIEAGHKTSAVSHFLHPKSEISNWFHRTVDSYPQDGANYAFSQTIKVERQNAIDKINQATTAAEIIEYATDYVSTADGVRYACSIGNLSQFDEDNTARLKKSIVRSIKEYRFGGGTFKLPSKDEEILNRTGCTDSCLWCGALCWGRRGHDQNTDNTRKHHTSHQPSGLHGTRHHTTNDLSLTYCCGRADNREMYSGDTYLGKWIDVKASPKYNNWIYCPHSQVEFNDLMKWFFRQIHNEIAERCGVEPAEEEKMSEWHISSIETIMSTLRAKISQG
ncbi:interferon-induced very large GTPase 1-like [Bradysia coprophila]|uniref:interferon-induced very large GTPase 1-like n=1 Tax=Bradysia coprophila TaxID=38358 RepID=UPI00187DD659|nr:interferon-induced very large GTPase 1-like [Bradysia coprophila]